ncbi:uncharacterized protein [Musca autumnalis]|uniref:uncharacterized protein n=1 Tax=Musca autumnalis TaxID=221902 RepID=UPI003CF12DDC
MKFNLFVKIHLPKNPPVPSQTCPSSMRNLWSNIAHTFAYQQHKLRHNPNPVRCEDCSFGNKSSDTKISSRLKHPAGGNRKYKCDKCPRICPNLRALKSHSLVHSNVYKFQCTVCENLRPKIFIRTIWLVTPERLYSPVNGVLKHSIAVNSILHRRKCHLIEREKEKRRQMYGEI